MEVLDLEEYPSQGITEIIYKIPIPENQTSPRRAAARFLQAAGYNITLIDKGINGQKGIPWAAYFPQPQAKQELYTECFLKFINGSCIVKYKIFTRGNKLEPPELRFWQQQAERLEHSLELGQYQHDEPEAFWKKHRFKINIGLKLSALLGASLIIVLTWAWISRLQKLRDMSMESMIKKETRQTLRPRKYFLTNALTNYARQQQAKKAYKSSLR